MSQSARGTSEERIRDYGTRRIQAMNGDGTRGVSLPRQLEETSFPTDLGDEVRITRDGNRVILEPVEK
jgi:hypothetical protein